jgi:hypothetical protein
MDEVGEYDSWEALLETAPLAGGVGSDAGTSRPTSGLESSAWKNLRSDELLLFAGGIGDS